MSANSGALGTFLQEVANWTWEEFCRAEHNSSYSSNQAMIFALVRACAMEKMEAIRLALNRIDGKLKTPIKIEYPKIYYLFPNATLPDGGRVVPGDTVPEDDIAKRHSLSAGDIEVMPPPEIPALEENDLPSLSLRQTVVKMADAPREVPEYVLTYAEQTQQWLHRNAEKPDEIPLVKSVVAAHLLQMAQNRNIDALTEVFDQIDGKLVETLQILGEDIYITSYSTIAPPEAYLNADGVLELEAERAQDMWAEKLGREKIS